MVYGETALAVGNDGSGIPMSNAEKCKQYYDKNRDACKQRQRAYRERNRERILAHRREKYRAKTRAWEAKRETEQERAMKLVMEAVNSPYSKVNDYGDLHPHEGDGYVPDQPPIGLVWISARPSKVLVKRRRHSYQPWVDAVIEAENRVYSLVQSGHSKARAVVDLHYEMAFTCDSCRLWAFLGHRSNYDKFSSEYEGGALFTEACDPTAIHRLFGEPFDPASAFDSTPPTDYGMDSSFARKGEVHAAATKKRRS